MWEAAVNVGFFTIVNHGISEAVIDNAFRVSQEFFALPVEEKEKASPFAPQLNAGYEHKSQAGITGSMLYCSILQDTEYTAVILY